MSIKHGVKLRRKFLLAFMVTGFLPLVLSLIFLLNDFRLATLNYAKSNTTAQLAAARGRLVPALDGMREKMETMKRSTSLSEALQNRELRLGAARNGQQLKAQQQSQPSPQQQSQQSQQAQQVSQEQTQDAAAIFAVFADRESLPGRYRLLNVDGSEIGRNEQEDKLSRRTERSLKDGEDADVLSKNWGILAAAVKSEQVVIRNAQPLNIVREGKRGSYVDVDHAGWAERESATICLRLAVALRGNDDQPVGFAVAELRRQDLEELLEPTILPHSRLLVLDEFWEPVACVVKAGHIGKIAPAASADKRNISCERAEQGAATGFTRAKSLYELRQAATAGRAAAWIAETGGYFEYLPGHKLYLALLSDESFSGKVVPQLRLATGIVICLSILLCLAAAWRFSRQFARPIARLNEQMKLVENGDWSARVEVSGTDEVAQLGSRFNLMTAELATTLERSVQQEKRLNDTRIRMMQSQLNPHFLYNTLDTVKWLGKINHAPDISTIATDLAYILRSSISGEEFVPLAKEIALVENYLEIQNIRFENQFHLELKIEDEAMNLIIPKLILQPLVENSLLHGLKNRDEGTVIIKAEVTTQNLKITVADTGEGFSPEKLAEFYQSRRAERTGHLGLYNVDAILRLHYGQAAGLHIGNRLPHGAEIVFTVPRNEPVDQFHNGMKEENSP